MTDTAAAPVAAVPAKRSLTDMIPGLNIKKSADLGLPGLIVLQGESTVGKTFATTQILKVPAYKSARIWFLDFEDGSMTVANDPQFKDAVDRGQVTIVVIDPTDTVTSYNQICALLGYKDERGRPVKGALFSGALADEDKPDIIIVDSLDVLQKIIHDYLDMTTLSSDGTKTDKLGAYGKLAPATKDVLWTLKMWQGLGLVVSHTQEKVDPKTQLPKLTMKLDGSARDDAPSIPDIIVNVTRRNDEAGVSHIVGELDGDESMLVKNRLFLNEAIWDFSLPRLYQIINGKLENTNKQIAAVRGGKKQTAAVAPAETQTAADAA